MLNNIIFIPSASSSSPLLNDLGAYWKLDETSGTRFDSTANNNDLTDNNTVGSAAGKIGNAASFVAANNEYLSVASAPELQIAGDFTCAMWVWADTTVGNPGFIGKNSTVGNREWHFIALSNNWRFATFNSSGGIVGDLSGPSVATGTWIFVVFGYDQTANEMFLSVNDGTPATVTPSGTIYAGNNRLSIGTWDRVSQTLDGLMDEIGIWQRVLSAAEITQLYNSGSGLTYPFV